MAKGKSATATQVALSCSICGVTVTPESYAMHVQTMHHAAPTASQPATPQQFTWQQPWGQQPQNVQPQFQPITTPIAGKDLAGGQYLKGEDTPQGVSEVRFKIIQFVRDPQGRSKLAAQITETYGKSLFGFNTTNIRAVMGLGFEDMQAIVGKTVVCMLGMQPNPQRGGQPTKALFVSRIE
jgi:hypothetical protein